MKIVQSADYFLKIPIIGKNANESKKIKLASLEKVVMGGRNVTPSHWIKVLPLFASFCTKKEKESAKNYRNASNLSSNLCANTYDLVYRELDGKTLSETLTAAKLAFIITIIHNHLVREEHNSLEWKPTDPSLLRFTGPKQRGGTGGWAQEGLDFFIQKVKEEHTYRKEIRKKFPDIKDRPDFFVGVCDTMSNEDVVDDHSQEAKQRDGDDSDYEINFSDDEEEKNMVDSDFGSSSPELL